MDKYQAFWPLPGGTEKFVDTLQKVLWFIKENRPSEEQLAAWFIDNFERVSLRGSTRGYIRTTLWHCGLVGHDKKGHFLTRAGEKYLANPDNFLLFKIFDEHVLGFRETVEIISHKELDMEELAKELTEKLGVNWQTAYGQPNWRVSWLRSMGFVVLEGGKFKLTQQGQELKSLPLQPEKKEEPSKVTVTPITPVTVQEIVDHLKDSQHLSQDPSKFEDAIAQAFTFLGFSTKQQGKAGDTDVLAVAHLGDESYSIVIDGKTTQGDRIIERQISWPSLSDHKKKWGADFIVVVGVSFAGGDLLQRAEEFSVTLIDSETLIKLLEIHDKTPLNLEDLKELFERKGVSRLEDCLQLMTVQAEYEKQQKLFPKVLESLYHLQQQGEPTHTSDIRWTLSKEFEQEEIMETLALLEKWGFVKKVTGDQWISLMTPRVAAKKLRAVADSFHL